MLLGLLIVSAGGLFSGAFAYPMARIKEWEWENIWLAYAFFGFFLIPTAVVAATFPGFLNVYVESGSRILMVFLFGTCGDGARRLSVLGSLGWACLWLSP